METRSAPVRNRRRRARAEPASAQQVKATLDDIRRIIGVDSKPVAAVLPEAVAQVTEERGTAFAVALEPAVARTLRVVASRDSQWLGEVLSPTIGVAVRMAVAASIAALMQRFNETLEKSLSLRSLQWRLEARRTGRPFAEVVLLRTLVYRVEQVFLIHSETGLVLQHLAAEGAPSADPDQVASMLSAIDSFGKEAFAPSSAAGEYLHEFAMGDLVVCIDKGASLALAVVVRGSPPRALRDVLSETREQILMERRADLAEFVADVEPFSAARPLLERCLREQRKEAPHRGPIVLGVLAAVLVAAVVALLVGGHSRRVAEERQLAAYRSALEAEPGIMITTAERRDGQFHFRGLRDPLAASPAELMARLGRPPAQLSFEPFYSLEPRVTENRFRQLTRAPSGVVVEMTGGTLHLSGRAPRQWIDQALRVASSLPGVERVEASVSDSTATELASAISALEATELHFDSNSSALAPAFLADLERAAQLIDRVKQLSSELQLRACVTVVGDADPSGTARRNKLLAAQRAAAVLAALRQRNPSTTKEMIRARARAPSDVGTSARTTRFQVRTTADLAGSCDEGAGP